MNNATGPEGTYTCAQRIQWLMKFRGEREVKACLKVAEEFPKECQLCAPEKSALVKESQKLKIAEEIFSLTCNVETCTRKVLTTFATGDDGDTHTCENRIKFLMVDRRYTEVKACNKVAADHQDKCGPCGGGAEAKPLKRIAAISTRSTITRRASRVPSDLKRKGLLTHWYNYVEETKRPQPLIDFTTVPEDKSKPPIGREVVFAIIGSCKLPERTLNADKTWCGAQFPDVICNVYIDCKTEDYPSEYKSKLKNVKLISESDYIFGNEHVPQPDCCNRTVDFQDKAAYDGLGPSTYFCSSGVAFAEGKHRSNTLQAQFRFLPALRHAKVQNLARFTRGASGDSSGKEGDKDKASWLVMVDDDSWVSIPRLLPVLGRYLPQERVQLGDFIRPYPVNATHWKRPFACGGAGTVLSAQAVMATDLDKCIQRFNHTCQQSDWMIGSCVAGYGVVAVVGQSCMTCGKSMNVLSNFELTQDAVIREKCAFTQITADILLKKKRVSIANASRTLTNERRIVPQWWTPYLLSTSAILHTKRPLWDVGRFSCADDDPTESEAPTTNSLLPQLQIIGAQKAGTTSLWSWLINNKLYCKPSVEVPNEPSYFLKEKHFFGPDRKCNQGMSLNAYRLNFPEKGDCKYIDSTPLISHPGVDPIVNQIGALQVFFSYPPKQRESLRLIAILREPVDRLLSWYRHLLRELYHCKKGCSSHYSCGVLWRCLDESKGRRMDEKGELVRCTRDIGAWPGAPDSYCPKEQLRQRAVMSFDDFVHLKGDYLISTSTYAPYVRLWRQYFGDKLLLLNFQDLVENTDKVLQKVVNHALGANSFTGRNMTKLERLNVHDSENKQESCEDILNLVPCKLRSKMNAFYARHNDILMGQEPTLNFFQTAYDCC